MSVFLNVSPINFWGGFTIGAKSKLTLGSVGVIQLSFILYPLFSNIFNASMIFCIFLNFASSEPIIVILGISFTSCGS